MIPLSLFGVADVASKGTEAPGNVSDKVLLSSEIFHDCLGRLQSVTLVTVQVDACDGFCRARRRCALDTWAGTLRALAGDLEQC